MSSENLIGNIDVVGYPEDKGVLIARTKEVLSIGVIKTPYKKSLVVCLPQNFEAIESHILEAEKFMTALEVYTLNNTSDAIFLATQLLITWHKDNSPEETLLKFSEVVKDAKVNQPHIRKLGGEKLSFDESLEQESKLAKVRDQGLVIPLELIIQPLRDKLI